MLKKKEKNAYGTVRTLNFMLKTAWKQRPTLFLLYFFQLLADCLNKIQVIVLPKFVLDELTLLLEGAEKSAHLHNAIGYALLTAGVALAGNLITALVNWRKSPVRVDLENYFEELLANHTMSMDFEHTEDPEALEQVARAKDGISWYSGGVVGILDELYKVVMNTTVLLGVITIICMKCPLLLPVQLGAMGVITWLNAKNNKLEAESYGKLSKINRIFGYVLFQLADFGYGKEIRLYESADMMREKGEKETVNMIAVWRNTAKAQRKNSWAMDVVNSFRDGISYFYIGYLAIKGILSIGDFSMCVAAASNFYWSLSNMVFSIQRVETQCKYASELLKMLDYPAAMVKGTKEPKEGNHVIEFCHVSFKYPRNDKFVLRDINLTIRSGEHLSIVGLNGAGKTTLIKLLCRLYDVTEGEIKIDGINIKEYSDEAYRKLFSIVFQDFQLFAFSLKDNIVLGETEDAARVEEVLKLSGLYDDAMKLENGTDTMLYKSFDEKGTELSGGQKQKTAISRALYRNAPIVILDEPTAALDPVAEYEIYRKFGSLVDMPNGIYAEMFAAQAQYYMDNTAIV